MRDAGRRFASLVCIPLCITLTFQVVLMASVHVVEYDEAVYMDVARNLQRSGLPIRSMGETGIYAFEHTPLHLYFLSLAGRLCGNNVFLLRLTTVGFALGSIGIVLAIGQSLRGPGAGTMGALLLALNPFFSTYSFFIRPEVPMCFFLLLAVYLLMWRESSGWRIWLAGLSIAIAVLLKEVALAFGVAAVLYIVLCGKGWKGRLGDGLSLAVPTLAGLSVWMGWGIALTPQQFLASLARWHGSVLGGGNVIDARMGIGLVEWLQMVSGSVVGWSSVLLLAVGVVWLWLSRNKPPRIVALLLLYVLVALGASLVMKLKEPRHVIGLIPTMALVVGLSIDWAAMWAWARLAPVRLVIAAAIMLLLVWNASPLRFPPRAGWRNIENWLEPPFADRVFQNDRYYGILRQAGLYLNAHTPPGTVVAVLHEGPVVGYYADRSYIFLYTLPHDKVIAALEQTRFLVVDQVVFTRQSAEETQRTLQYIGEHFEVEQVIQDAYRQITLYRRRGAAYESNRWRVT